MLIVTSDTNKLHLFSTQNRNTQYKLMGKNSLTHDQNCHRRLCI